MTKHNTSTAIRQPWLDFPSLFLSTSQVVGLEACTITPGNFPILQEIAVSKEVVQE